MLVICCLTRVINGNIIEDEAIYNFWRFLVEDFFLPVIKPPGTYFNNKLLPSCRSSKFSSSFPATRILLCAPLDPVRPDRNSKSAWRQSVLIFLRQTLHWKLWRAATILSKWFSTPIPLATTWIDLCWILCNSTRVVATFKEDSFDGRPHLNFFHSTFSLDCFRKTKEKQCKKYN